MQTVEAFKLLQKYGVTNIELFLNTFSELDNEYINKLKKIKDKTKQNIIALHPFTCALESFFFATHYDTRKKDGFDFYKQYFETCNKLEISFFNFHGMHKDVNYPLDIYCENIAKLRDLGREFNVELCHENVVRCKFGYTKNIIKMRKLLNDDISFTLDIKQMRRANIKTQDMVNAMGKCVKYLHLSDCDNDNDCTLPGTGNYDFEHLFNCLAQHNFTGDGVIELYSDSFTSVESIISSAQYLQKLYDNTNVNRKEF